MLARKRKKKHAATDSFLTPTQGPTAYAAGVHLPTITHSTKLALVTAPF